MILQSQCMLHDFSSHPPQNVMYCITFSCFVHKMSMFYSKIVLKLVSPIPVLESLYEVGTRCSNHRPVSDYYEHKL